MALHGLAFWHLNRAQFTDARQLLEEAITHQEAALQKSPQDAECRQFLGNHYCVLGRTHLSANEWQQAITALEQGLRYRSGHLVTDHFYLAIANARHDQMDKAREWYQVARQRMAKHAVANEQINALRAEAERLLGIDGTKDHEKDGPARPEK